MTADPGSGTEPAVRGAEELTAPRELIGAPELIGARNVSKSFGGVRALDSVDFSAVTGEIHAIVGENGAGKSTLMRLLGGALPPDSGTIVLDGEPVLFAQPRDALAAGVRTIHQEFTLLPELDVVENVFLGQLRRGRGGSLDWRSMRRESARIFERLGVEIDLTARVGDLSVAQHQLVEIAKALSTRARVVIMDEPSAVLAGADLERLFGVVEALRAGATTVLYISHRLPEVFRLADRVTVLRNGEVIASGRVASELTEASLVSLMLGRSLAERDRERAAPASGRTAPRLRVRGLASWGFVRDVDIEVGRGEIVGLAGLVGAGRSTLLRTIFGADPRDAGTVSVDDRDVAAGNIRASMRAGIGFLPEDRKALGLVLPFSIRDNLTLTLLERVARAGVLSRTAETAVASSAARATDVRSRSLSQPVEQLSGGNQQKVALAKWMARRPAVLLLDEPTRGVDIGAKTEIHRLLRELAEGGTAIIVTSSDLGELLALADRLVVMRDGRLVGGGRPNEMREEEVLAAAVTHSVDHLEPGPSGARYEAGVAQPEAADGSAGEPTGAGARFERPATRTPPRRPLGIGRSSAASIWLALIVLAVIVGLMRPAFWDPSTLSNIARQAAVLGLVALGQSVVVIAGGIDLSVAGTVKLTSLLGAGLLAGQLGQTPLAVGVMVGVAILVGLVNALVVVRVGAAPFMVTLGTLLVLQGISLTYAPSSIGRVPPELVALYDASVGPVPLPVAVLFVAYALLWLTLRHTSWGRDVYAVGGSPTVSRLAGIPVSRTRLTTYLLSALLCVLAASILLTRSGVGDPRTGDGLELSSITAVVLGGTSLFGGRGSVLGTLGGVLFLVVASTMLNLLQIPTYYQALVSGLVIALAVAARRQR